jgi:hypothetical protein
MEATGTVGHSATVSGPHGASGVAVLVEVLEDAGVVRRTIARVTLGDLLHLTLDDGRRASLRVADCDVSLPLGEAAPLEALEGALLAAAAGARGGALHAREAALREGDRVRVDGPLTQSGGCWVAAGRTRVVRA